MFLPQCELVFTNSRVVCYTAFVEMCVKDEYALQKTIQLQINGGSFNEENQGYRPFQVFRLHVLHDGLRGRFL
jgi:hypothetical protein